MGATLEIADIVAEVTLKDIKNVHLSVYPPRGAVRISAPAQMSLDNIRLFAVSRLQWIRRQQAKVRDQERETRREYVNRESHYVWGSRRLLQVIESPRGTEVAVAPGRLILTVRPGATWETREAMVAQWYRDQVRAAVPPLLSRWEAILGVEVGRFFVRQMKTKWGSCNHRTGTIRLNTELAKKPRRCLEYVVVHEMVHLLEPTHNATFTGFMDQAMPQWREVREGLNRLPVRHSDWSY